MKLLLTLLWNRRYCYMCGKRCHGECCSTECREALDTHSDLMAMHHGC
jgi:hypothetical protein